MTEYVILTHASGSNDWIELEKRIPARSGGAAIRAMLNGEGDTAMVPTPSGTYVAVPARSFRPVKVKVETKTSLKFS